MVNFYIYYNIYMHTHTYIYIYIYIVNIKNNGKSKTVYQYWPVSKYIVSLVKSGAKRANFKHGVIEIPNIAIDDYTTSFLVNCVAFEQCHNYELRYIFGLPCQNG